MSIEDAQGLPTPEEMLEHLKGIPNLPEQIRDAIMRSIAQRVANMMMQDTIEAIYHCVHHDKDMTRIKLLVVAMHAFINKIDIPKSKAHEFAELIDEIGNEAGKIEQGVH